MAMPLIRYIEKLTDDNLIHVLKSELTIIEETIERVTLINKVLEERNPKFKQKDALRLLLQAEINKLPKKVTLR